MMPMALGMMFLLQLILAHLFVSEDTAVAALAPRRQGAEAAPQPALRPRQAVPPVVVSPGGGGSMARRAD